MYTKRRVMVILLMVVMTASLFFAPAVILNQPEVAPAQASSPVDQRADAIDSIVQRINDNTIGLEKYDTMLASYISGGGLPEDAIATPDGGVQVLMFMTPNVDMSAIGALSKIKWTIDLNLLQVAMATVSSPRAVEMLTQIDGLRYITADKSIDAPDFEPVESEPTMFQITDVVGATDAWTSGYNGSGTVVGFTDSSIDFSIPDLVNSVGYDTDGRPMSYDPSAMSMQFLSYANATNVNATAWTAAGYPLTYESGGKYYLNVTGWDPLMARAPFSASAHYLRRLISEQFGAYGGGLDVFINNFLWEDWELPDLSGLTWDNVSVGWIFQVRDYSYARLFAPMLVLDGSELVIDWAAAKAFTQLFHDVYWYETVENPLTLDYITYITDMMDWSFADDYADGWYYGFEGVGKGAAVYYKPNPSDYSGYMGLGSLGWVYDELDFYTSYFNETYFAGTGMNATVEDLWCGFRSDGLGVALLYPEYDGAWGNNHGTWTGHAAVSEGNYGHTVYSETDPLNDTEYFLPGVAPGASAANVKWYGYFGARFGGAFWLAGFHLNSTSAPYHWEYTGQHKADFLSMSWGYTWGAFLDLYYTSLCFDIISIPGLIDPEYEGLLMFGSSGNEGPDYMTSAPPSSAGAVVSVGGSTTFAYYDNVYAEGQGTGQDIAFGSKGPSYIGWAQPDVIAPGYRGANSRPAQDFWFLDYTENPFYVENDWTVDLPTQTYDWWQGTSLSCPIAAGVAAIILDALDSQPGYAGYDPFLIKEILMSSATDQGLDQYVQGHGLVNAGAAVNYILGGDPNEYYFTNTDSYDNYLDATADAWWLFNEYYTNVYGYDWYDLDPSLWSGKYPSGVGTSSIYFGNVFHDETAEVAMTTMGYDGNTHGYVAATGDYDVTPWTYVKNYEMSFDAVTWEYSDTNFDPAEHRFGHYNLTAELDAIYDIADINAAFDDEYAFILVTSDASEIGDTYRAELFDWADDGIGDLGGNGLMNYYSIYRAPWGIDYITGDTMKEITLSYSTANCQLLRIGDPNGISNLFDHTPTLVVGDRHPGSDIKVTLITWQRVADPRISVIEDTDGFNLSLTVPSNSEGGIHGGFVQVVDSSSGYTHEIPYSYMVGTNLTLGSGEIHTLADGNTVLGTDYTPYDNGAMFCAPDDATSTAYGQLGGHRTFLIEVPDVNATALFLKVDWENPGTVIDIYLKDTYDSSYWYGTTEGALVGETYNTVLYDTDNDPYMDEVDGRWYFEVFSKQLNGTDPYEKITVTAQWFTDIPVSTPTATWYANDVAPSTFGTNSSLSGDHVTINMTWSDLSVPNMPLYQVTSVNLDMLSGLFVERTGDVREPYADVWPINLDRTDTYVWEGIKGILESDNVRVRLAMQPQGDPSFAIYEWHDDNGDNVVDYPDEVGAGPFLSVDDGGSDFPESGSFLAPYDMDICVVVWTWLWQWSDAVHITYTLTVDTRSAIPVTAAGDTVEYDTFLFFGNVKKDLQLTAFTDTDAYFYIEYKNVSIVNLFSPTCEVLTPNGGEDWSVGTHNITWSAEHVYGDSFTFQIRYSKDGGTYWEILGSGPMHYDAVNDYYYYTWLTTPIVATDEAIIEITAFNNNTDYAGQYGLPSLWPGWSASDQSDDVFSLGSGTIPVVTTTPTTTPTTPTTTTPTTPPTTPPPVIDPLWLGLIAGVGVGVVVVLILFLVKKR